MNPPQKVLLSGSAGKLGRRVAAALRKQKQIEIQAADIKLGIDIMNKEQIRPLISQTQSVIHLAALPHPGMAPPGDYFWINTVGTLSLIEAAAKARHERFVYISSGAVYGWDLENGLDDLQRPVTVRSPLATCRLDVAEPYTLSKTLAEKIVRNYGLNYDLQVVILRLAPIWNSKEAASAKFLHAAVSPQTAVKAIVNALFVDLKEQVSCYNIADPDRCGDYSVVEAIADKII